MENLPVDLVKYYNVRDWAGVAPGAHFYKYCAPLDHLSRSKGAVEARRQQMLNPEFARRLRQDVEGQKQCIKDWQREMKWVTNQLEYHNAIAKAQHDIDVLQDYLVRIEDGCYHLL